MSKIKVLIKLDDLLFLKETANLYEFVKEEKEQLFKQNKALSEELEALKKLLKERKNM